MTAKDLLLQLVKRQKKSAYLSGNWDKLKPEVELSEDGSININFDSAEIGFSFDKNGRFQGIYNWKQ